MRVDYERIISMMLEHLQKEEDAHRHGEMMSLAEAIHGEISARYHREYLEQLIKDNTRA